MTQYFSNSSDYNITKITWDFCSSSCKTGAVAEAPVKLTLQKDPK